MRSLAAAVAFAVVVPTASATVLVTPVQAAGPDAGIAELRSTLDSVGEWTAQLGEAGKLAERIPMVGRSPGSVLGFPDLVQRAVADELDGADVDAWGDLSGTRSIDLGDGRTGELDVTHAEVDGGHRVGLQLTLSKTLTSEPFSFDSTTPKLSLSSAGGVSVTADLDLRLDVAVVPNGSGWSAYVVRDGATTPSLTVDVAASLPAAGLSASIGILGVTATETTPDGADAELHLVGSVDDPDGDGKLYVTKPDGTAGELKDPAAAAGLISVGFAPAGAGSVDIDLTLKATASTEFSLPALSAQVSIDWADVAGAPPVVDATGLDPVTAFQNLSPRDLADMLGQLVSVLNGSQRSPANELLPFLSGSVADAVQGAEALVDFLTKNVVQPPADADGDGRPDANDTVDPARVGEPSFRSIQDLVSALNGYTAGTELAGADLGLTVGTYGDDRLPMQLTLSRAATDVDMVPESAAVAGSAVYDATSLTDLGAAFTDELVGRRVIAGSSGGTVASVTPTELTLTADGWVGGTPANTSSYSVSGPAVDAGTVELANLLGSGGKGIVNANGITPTATVSPGYTATLKFALDLSAPRTGDDCTGPTGVGAELATACPYTRTNPDGSKLIVSEEPLPVERLLIGTGYDLLTADFPITAGIDVHAKVGFLEVTLGGSVTVCSTSASATCTDETAAQDMLRISLNKLTPAEADYVPVAEFFRSLVGTEVATRLTVDTNVRAHVTGSVAVPDAAAFLPGGATAGFTASWGDLTADATPTVVVDDLSELLAFDIDPTDPQAMLGIILRALQLLDEQLQSSEGGGGVLDSTIPLVDRSLRDFLGSDEAGGGPTVTYGADTDPDPDGTGPLKAVDRSLLTDTSRVGDRAFPESLKGRSIVVGTKVGVVLDVVDGGKGLAMTRLQETSAPDPAYVPAAGTAYFLRTELADALSLLTAAPPDSVQELIRVLDSRLTNDTPLAFTYEVLGGEPHLGIGLDWDRTFSTETPLTFDVGGKELSGGGTGSAKVTVSASIDAGLAVPLALPTAAGTVPLKVMDDSSITLEAVASATGTLQANVGPLALSLGKPGGGDDAQANAHYSVGLSKAGGTGTTASDLVDFLNDAAIEVNDYEGAADCGEGTDGTKDPLALCADLPLYTSSNDGSSWSPLFPKAGEPTVPDPARGSVTLRLPKDADIAADYFAITGTVSATDTRPRLQAPNAQDMLDAFAASLLDFGLLGDGIDAFLQLVEDALNAANQDGKLPVVGNDLQGGADFVGKVRTELDALFVQIEEVNGGKLPDVPTINTWLKTGLNDALVAAGANPSGLTVDLTCLLPTTDVTGVTATLPGGETAGTAYEYAVVAVGRNGGSDVDTMPGAPGSTDNAATLDAAHSNEVAWTSVPQASSYKVLRKDAGDWVLIGTALAGTLTFTDDGKTATAYDEKDVLAVVDVCTGAQIYDIEGVVLRVDLGTGVVDAASGCVDAPDKECLRNEIPLDIGVPGLAIRPAKEGDGSGLAASVGWRVHLAVALDKKDGLSLLTKDIGLPELAVGLNVDLTAPLTAELAFLQIEVTKQGTLPAFAAAFQVDLKSGDADEETCWTAPCDADPSRKLTLSNLLGAEAFTDLVGAQLDLNLSIDWLLKATADAALPGVQARLVMSWDQVVNAATISSQQLAELELGFEDVAIDAGAFLTEVIGPIVQEIKKITGPVQPIIDTLYAPIPVISDLSQLAGGPPVSLITLAKTFSTLAGGPDLTFVDTVAKVITFVNELPTPLPGENMLVPIGSFDLDPAQAWNVEVTPDTGKKLIKDKRYNKRNADGTYTAPSGENDEQDAAPKQQIDSKSANPSLVQKKPGQTTSIAEGAGFELPLLDSPALIFDLIMGGDIDLVTFNSGDLGLAFTWRQAFGPVYAPPPVFITLSGSASVTAHIEAGFDTYGLRKVFEDGLTGSTAAGILNGLYFRSTDDAGAPLPVVTFYGEIAAGAAVSAVIITVGLEGGVSLTIHLAWNDPNSDGKFRLFEFGQAAMLNPLCLFQMSGRIGLFLRLYITLGMSPFSVSFDITLADITLLDFSVKPDCAPPPPRLGGVTDGTLVVFAGDLGKGSQRGNGAWDNSSADYGDEVVKVTQLHDFAEDGTATPKGVAVTMLGITETWTDPGITRVVVDGRDYDHRMKITFLGDGDKTKTGTAPEIVPTGGFDLEAVVLGGSQGDVVKTGSGRSLVDGGAGNDTISLSDAPGGEPTWVAGGANDDSISTGNRNAIAAGDSRLGGYTTRSLTLTRADGASPETVLVADVVDWTALTAPSGAEAGTDGGDRVAVGRGVNTTYAGAGNDSVAVASDSELRKVQPLEPAHVAKANRIVLGSGSDSAKGGSADDTIYTGQEVVAQTREAPDTDGTGGAESAGLRNTVDTGTGNDSVFGSVLADHVTGGSTTTQKDVFVGGGGNDVLLGALGTDELYGGPGKDWVVAEPATVGDTTGDPAQTDGLGTLVRSYAKTPLPGGTSPSAKVLAGGDGADRVIGGDGPATIFGDRVEGEVCGTPVLDPRSDPPAEDLTGSPGRDLITGGEGVDTVKAGGAADRVTAYGGADLLCGQAGDDEVFAGSGDDTVWGGTGADRVYGDADADQLFGNDGPDQLFGDSGTDVLEGNDGADRAFGGTGDDQVLGGTRAAGRTDVGRDELYGGDGVDVLIGDNGSGQLPYDLDGTVPTAGDGDRLYGGTGDDTGFGGLGGDVVLGGPGDDHLEGNNAGDEVYGEAGEDELVGGSYETLGVGSSTGRPDGADRIDGGAGSDVIAGDNAVLSRTGTPSDLVRGRGFLHDHAIELLDLGTAPAAGTSGGDTINGGDAADVVLAQGGTDTVHGDGGDDLLEGGPARDVVHGDVGEDDVVGGSSAVQDAGTGQPDVDDLLSGGSGADVIAGDNALVLRVDDAGIAVSPVTDRDGMAARRAVRLLDLGHAPASGTSGGDTITGDADPDVVFAGGGDDLVNGNGGDDYLEGNQAADRLFGDAGEDDLLGGSSDLHATVDGFDVGQLDGGDTLVGGDGADVMTGDNAVVLRKEVAGQSYNAVTQRSGMTAPRTLVLQDLGLAPVAGTSGDDLLSGEAGVDVLLAGGGSDVARGDSGDDHVEGNAGTDLLEGNDGHDDLVGGSASTLSGEGDGRTGQLDGADWIYGGAGDDLVLGDNARVVRSSGADEDELSALTDRGDSPRRAVRLLDQNPQDGSFLEALGGRGGADRISGGSGVDVLLGQDDADALSGGPGEDHLEGNGGPDQLWGDRLLNEALSVLPAPLTGRSEGVALDGDPAAADGQDDLIGGSTNLPSDSGSKVGRNGFRDGNDLVYGDGGADFVLGDNGTLFRDRDGDGWKRISERYPIADADDEAKTADWAILRHAVRLDVPSSDGEAPQAGSSGADLIEGNAGEDFLWGQSGDDTMTGNDGNDDMYGELGADTMSGNAGEDAMVGDRGGIVTRFIDGGGADSGDPTSITTTLNSPPQETYTSLRPGTLDRRVDLLHDVAAHASPDSGSTADWAGDTMRSPGQRVGSRNAGEGDRMRGGLGHDSMHGGADRDLMNGDSGGDIVFGGNGSDVLWGGKGCDLAVDAATADCRKGGAFDPSSRGTNDRFVDYLLGGHGGLETNGTGLPELLDFRPRGSTVTPGTTCSTNLETLVTGDRKNPVLKDPCAWFAMTDSADDSATPTSEQLADNQHHQGTDWIYGGWGRDVMEGDVTANGPNPGDRMIDGAGVYNLWNHCNAAYGGFNDIRQFSPGLLDFMQKLAYGLGAGEDLAAVKDSSSSAFDELSLIYTGDIKKNTGKAYPTTPGHFESFSCAP